MFSTRYIKRILIAAAAVMAVACTHTPDTDSPEPNPEAEAEPASLTIDFSVADLGIEVDTRANESTSTDESSDTDLYNPDLVEGNAMSCLTVLLINRTQNKIVGIREIGNIHSSEVHKNLDATGNENGFLKKNEDGVYEVKPDAQYGTRARVTFNYNYPIHVKDDKSVERLLRGEYRLFVIANYNHTVPTSKKPTPEGGTETVEDYETVSLQNTLDGIVTEFHNNADKGIDNFNPKYEYFYNLRFLMNRAINNTSGKDRVDKITDENGKRLTPNIRPAVNQTLSATQNVYLAAGDNHVSVKLLRISSRTKVEVRNYGPKPLKVHSLEFCPNYTQTAIYLFRREENDRNNYEHYYETGNYEFLESEYYAHDYLKYDDNETEQKKDFKGAPDVSFSGVPQGAGVDPETGAIVPFITVEDDPRKNDVVEPNETKCIFDALMYESRDKDNPFTYTIDVSYPEETGYRTTDKLKLDLDKTISDGGYDYALKITPKYITSTSSAEQVYNTIKENYSSESDFFLIQGVGSGKYLYEDENGELHAAMKNPIILTADDIKSYLWTVEVKPNGTGGYLCSLKNAKTGGHYMPIVPQGEAANLKGSTEHQWNSLEVHGDNVSFSNTHSGTSYYLSIWQGYSNLGGWTSADVGCQYRLYPVKAAYVGTPRTQKTVTLTAFNDKTAVVEDVHEIQRNDFVRILIEVSYNPEKSDFEFKVSSWKEGGGDVYFN